jgi:hypothetical protein
MNGRKLIQVSLELSEWRAIMDLLSDGRYRTVAPLIRKIHEQTQTDASDVTEASNP